MSKHEQPKNKLFENLTFGSSKDKVVEKSGDEVQDETNKEVIANSEDPKHEVLVDSEGDTQLSEVTLGSDKEEVDVESLITSIDDGLLTIKDIVDELKDIPVTAGTKQLMADVFKYLGHARKKLYDVKGHLQHLENVRENPSDQRVS